MNLGFASIKDIKTALDTKKISTQELLHYFLKRCMQHDKDIASLIELFDFDSIMNDYSNGGILNGIPGIMKDNICVQGRIASCGSKILANYKAPYDATVTKRLKKEGALLIARANCDEFAMGSSTETSAYGNTKNPWDVGRVPGGSSGGSAAAVAAGLAPWSLGTETGGSVRQPAAFCNIVGLKPTYGLVSRYGIVSYASSLDQVGVFARTVADTATVFSAIAGHDENDSSSLKVPPKDYAQSLSKALPTGLRIGIIENAFTAEGMDQEISAAVSKAADLFVELGATIKKVQLPILDYGAATYFIVSRAEAASNLARFDGIRYGVRSKDATSLSDVYQNTRHDGFGPEVRKRIMVGNYVLSAGHAGQFYENAKRVIRLMRHDMNEAFKDVDILLLPTHSVPAFPFGAYSLNKLQMDLQDYFTCQANLTGVPAISVPCGFTKTKLPIGMQLMAPHLQEELLLQVAHAYEQRTQWHTMHPDGY
jgi:aspartyl-tRNA(Asn)/glutamyl-tRNA(Gln) amidotransferase subunit A